MQVDPRMYDRPMTEEEKRLMMIQGLRQNNMSMADSNSVVRESELNLLDPSSVVRESEILNQGMNLSPNSVVREGERIPFMRKPTTTDQIDEEIMRLQILRQIMETNGRN